jgi:hypothetical protein
MDLISALASCLTGRSNPSTKRPTTIEKPHFDKPERTAQDIAKDVITILRTTEKRGRELERALQNAVGEYGWTENIAKAILGGLENVIKTGATVAEVMKEAIEKAASAAVGFARDHPVYCTILALGVLVLLAPWAIEALGFGELGPIEGMIKPSVY